METDAQRRKVSSDSAMDTTADNDNLGENEDVPGGMLMYNLFKRNMYHVLTRIFMSLPPEDLSRCRQTCVQWREYIDSEVLGKPHLARIRQTVYSIEIIQLSMRLVKAIRSKRSREAIALLSVPELDCGQAKMALSWAARMGQEDTVRALVARSDVNVNVADEQGYTPLMAAAFNGHAAVVRALLDCSNVDVHAATRLAGTALTRAAENGKTDVLKLLLAQPGVDVNVATGFGNTPLMLACKGGHEDAALALLAAPGVEVNRQNRNGGTALMLALSAPGCERLITSMLKNTELDVNKSDREKNYVALHIWIMKPILKRLARILSMVNLYSGSIIICPKIFRRDLMGGRITLDHETNFNATQLIEFFQRVGWTALMFSAFNSSDVQVEQLLTRPTLDVSATNSEGKSALDIAREKLASGRIVEMLTLQAAENSMN